MSRPVDPRLLTTAPAARRLLAAYALLSVVGGVATVAQAVVLAGVIAHVVHGWSADALVSDLVLLAGVGLARALLAAYQEWLAARGSVRVRAQLRAAVLSAVRRLGPAWAQAQPPGRLVTAAGPGLEGLDGYLSRALPALVGAAIVPGAVLAFEMWTDWRSGIILLLVLPLVPLFMALVGVTTGRRMQRQYDLLARMSGHFLDLVAGLTTLRVYGQAARQVTTVRAVTESYRRHTMATLRTAFLSSLVLDLVATLSVAVVAVDVGLRLDHGSMNLATALLVLLLAPELFAPLRAMGAQHHATEEGRAAAAAALDVITEADDLPPVESATPAVVANEVCVEALTVTYPGRDTPALDDVTVRFAPGTVTVLRGRSGSGKSTVLSSLLGFTTPNSGTAHIGDAVLWRANIAWVPQRPRSTQRTVGAEVALGNPSASAQQITDAVAACRAPHPDTPLGEDGTAVSAGQRRRVALARSLLRARARVDAGAIPIVLLDEPSEDLDVRTEAVVVSMLAELAGHATVVVATHSDVVSRAADRVVDLAEGQVTRDRQQSPSRSHVAPVVPLPPIPAVGSTGSDAPRPSHAVGHAVLPARRTAKLLAVAGLLSGAAGLASLALTASSIWLICRASQHPNVQALEVAVVGVRTFALARALLRYLERLVAHDGALRLLADVRSRVFAALVPLVPTGVDLRRGDLLRRFVTDVDGVQEGLVRAVVPMLGATVTAAGAVALAAVLVPAGGAVLAVGLLVGLVAAPASARLIAGHGGRLSALTSERDVWLTGVLDGLAELTAYGADGVATTQVTELDAQAVGAARRPAAGAALGVLLAGGAAAVSFPLVLAAAAGAVSNGALSGVTAAVLAACALAGFDALAGVPAAFAAWSRCRAGYDRVGSLLATPVPLPEPAHPLPVPSWATGHTGLVVDSACVAPAPGAPLVVVNESLTLRHAERVALVGPSGCGKSTLLAAAMRLLPVRYGSIDVDCGGTRIPLRDLAATDVPPVVAGSLQGDHVFDASLRDNLRVVRPAASDDDLDEVAAYAGLTGFIATLPDGWATPAGGDGALLSGGQRQRLLLARALLAAPDVLVLDEPTAHLDVDTEREVIADLLSGTTGRTVLMSTHRPLSDGSVTGVVTMSLNERPGTDVLLSPAARGGDTATSVAPEAVAVPVA